MKTNVYLCMVSACLSGCMAARPSADSTFLHLAGRNFHQSTSMCVEDQVFKHTADKHARAAWRQVCKLAPEGTLSLHYKDGFIEGYVDYLDAGGTGEPPAMGPFRYRLHEYQTFEGRRAIHDWFAGFRHGASVARASGLRELILIPVASFPCKPPPLQFYSPPSGQLRSRSQDQLYSVPPSRPSTDSLPPPKSLSDPVTPPQSNPEVKNDNGESKVRLLLPEPLPIALQQGGAR